MVVKNSYFSDKCLDLFKILMYTVTWQYVCWCINASMYADDCEFLLSHVEDHTLELTLIEINITS